MRMMSGWGYRIWVGYVFYIQPGDVSKHPSIPLESTSDTQPVLAVQPSRTPAAQLPKSRASVTPQSYGSHPGAKMYQKGPVIQ